MTGLILPIPRKPSNIQTITILFRKGIDVSNHNGRINWKKVKKAGIDFVFIRLGYRGYGNGSLNIDKEFCRNFKIARKAGIDNGVYFFSQAVNEKEFCCSFFVVITDCLHFALSEAKVNAKCRHKVLMYNI